MLRSRTRAMSAGNIGITRDGQLMVEALEVSTEYTRDLYLNPLPWPASARDTEPSAQAPLI